MGGKDRKIQKEVSGDGSGAWGLSAEAAPDSCKQTQESSHFLVNHITKLC